jgi:hypothetical protein
LSDFLPGFQPPDGASGAEDFWFSKWVEISELFSPTAPVRESDLFAGRGDQIHQLVEAMFQAGQHAVIYGDRGVGKTSLVNVVLQKIFGRSKGMRFLQTQCYSGDDFVKIWERVFKEHQWSDGEYAFDDIDDTLDSDQLLGLTRRFNPNNKPVFIFDEFDRVTDQSTKLQMAETIKLFSDRSSMATIVLVGVGRTISELLIEHESVKRALKQVEMPRMSPGEIREIISIRIGRLGMEIEEPTLENMTSLARGMPAYAHLLGMYSAKAAAMGRRSLRIEAQDLWACLDECLSEAGESTRQAYAQAIRSPQPNNLLAQTLLACAIANQDQFGSFTAASLKAPLSELLHRERSIPDYARHLKDFCSHNRGFILEKEGNHKNYRYRFTDPMMQSFVIMKGLKDGLLPIGNAN